MLVWKKNVYDDDEDELFIFLHILLFVVTETAVTQFLYHGIKENWEAPAEVEEEWALPVAGKILS